ncbi:hypothetical protein [Aliikangiella sp. IMCC44359]|uniref:hypothetical protein n=1 Tax=Aliikangiella sp. IMCC44359 TaxID=3459125 RepID=UPI00403B157D
MNQQFLYAVLLNLQNTLNQERESDETDKEELRAIARKVSLKLYQLSQGGEACCYK